MMKKMLAGLLAAAVLVAGCGGSKPAPAAENPKPEAAQPAEEKRLTLYTSFGADLYNPIVQAFEEKTGIKVDTVFGGTGEVLNRIKAEKDAPMGDVMLGGGSESYEAYREYFTTYQVKNAETVPANLKAKDGLWYGFNSLPMVIMYNKNAVKESEKPAGWKDLLDPKWKGKLAIADATKSGTSFVQVATVVSIFGREGGKGWETVEGIVKNAKVLSSSSLPPKGVNDGEYALALTHENAAWKFWKAGGQVGWVYPTEGTSAIADSVGVIKGGKHPNNAKLFMEFLFSKETQELASTKLGLRPARADITPPEGLVPTGQIKFITLEDSYVIGQREQILNSWKDVVTKQ